MLPSSADPVRPAGCLTLWTPSTRSLPAGKMGSTSSSLSRRVADAAIIAHSGRLAGAQPSSWHVQEGAQPHDQAAGEQGLQVTQADDLEPLEQLAEDTPPTGSDWEVMSPPVPSRSTTPRCAWPRKCLTTWQQGADLAAPVCRPEEQQAASTDAADSLQHIPIVDEQSPAADAAEQAEQASQHSRPGSETSLTGGRWQLTGDSDHDQESAFSDLESELDRASSPSPSATLSALRLTSQHHGHGGASSSQPPSSPAAASQVNGPAACTSAPARDEEGQAPLLTWTLLPGPLPCSFLLRRPTNPASSRTGMDHLPAARGRLTTCKWTSSHSWTPLLRTLALQPPSQLSLQLSSTRYVVSCRVFPAIARRPSSSRRGDSAHCGAAG